MTEDPASPSRIVDAHVHLWDPERADWYPYLAGRQKLDLGDVSAMARRFDPDTYFSECGDWNVEKLINVAAATGEHSVAETIELDRQADKSGFPNAIIGGLLPAVPVAEALEAIEVQAGSSRFRGVRPMGPVEGPLPHREVLAALAEQRLVFEVMAHPDRLGDVAATLGSHPELAVVVEHLGWPREDTHDEFELWEAGMSALADLGPNVSCKLSGLAMPLQTMAAATWRRWVQRAIELFGTQRCLFASNFPVDGLHGTLDQLIGAWVEAVGAATPEEADAVFATNAERIYRL